MYTTWPTVLGLICVFLGIIAIIAAFVAFIFMLLWNFVIAGVFGAPTLTFLQAWGLWILVGIVKGIFVSRPSK